MERGIYHVVRNEMASSSAVVEILRRRRLERHQARVICLERYPDECLLFNCDLSHSLQPNSSRVPPNFGASIELPRVVGVSTPFQMIILHRDEGSYSQQFVPLTIVGLVLPTNASVP
jgi:hypothetical protein